MPIYGIHLNISIGVTIQLWVDNSAIWFKDRPNNKKASTYIKGFTLCGLVRAIDGGELAKWPDSCGCLLTPKVVDPCVDGLQFLLEGVLGPIAPVRACSDVQWVVTLV